MHNNIMSIKINLIALLEVNQFNERMVKIEELVAEKDTQIRLLEENQQKLEEENVMLKS